MLRLFFMLLSLTFILEARSVQMEAKELVGKFHEIMQAHVVHKRLNTVLMSRMLQNFVDGLDPVKNYFIKGELKPWLEASDEELNQMVLAFERADFTVFEAIFDQAIEAIKRRQGWQERLDQAAFREDVSFESFKDLEWAGSEEELFERQVMWKSLQQQASEKLEEPELKERALQRMQKRRIGHEQEVLERKQGVLYSFLLKAGASALDNHTAYFTPSEATQFMINVQQRLFGIGAQLRDDLNGFSVVKIIKGGPADLAGDLREKDRIIAVDGEPVVGMEISDAVDLIRGEEGKEVVLSVLRRLKDSDKDEKVEIRITRGEVVLEETRIKSFFEPYGDGVIACIRLFSFYQDPLASSSADLLQELKKMQLEKNVKGLILDLRYNSGGILQQAVEVAGLFISKGIVASIKDANEHLQHLRDSDSTVAWSGPLIVLTNRASASAAEIVAQALQDYGKAIVVGDETTFGKGTYQTFTLDSSLQGSAGNPQGEYKVTRGRYYTVSGKSPQLAGVHADIVVPGLLAKAEIGERYAKFAIENESIEANFEDDLSDIPKMYRPSAQMLYHFNLQKPEKRYASFLDQLKNNSSLRLEENKNYQNFLKNIEEEESQEPEPYGSTDVQLSETFNIMKDLIFLMQLKIKEQTDASSFASFKTAAGF